MNTHIEFDDISHFFVNREGKLTQALEQVNLTVQRGEFVCLIGPSGCGKTTLLHLLAGFMPPTQGAVRFKGEVVQATGSERGMVFQEYALFPWMTAKQNVEFGLRSLSFSAQQRAQKALAALEKVHLIDAAHRYPHEMSGGMRQRVAVARSLVMEPEVLLMDEPFAAVDALTRHKLQQELLALWQELGVTVLFITHNIDEALFLAQRVVVMAPNPGSITDIVPIVSDYPRQRSSAEFSSRYQYIEHSLAQGHQRIRYEQHNSLY